VIPATLRTASLPPTKGHFVNRLWSRVSVRVISVVLLLAGVVGGVYLGRDRGVQQRSAGAQLVVLSDSDEMQLLRQRNLLDEATRAQRRQAEGDAAAKAAAEAKAAASKARKLEKAVIAKKKAEAEAKAAAEKKKAAAGKDSTSGATVPYTGPIPASCNEFSGNRATGCALMLQAGFKIDQFPCLNKLFNRESGWNHKAYNSSTGAYGIPQALPGSKMASVGADWKTNPATQIKWGLGYIEGRYSTPCGAWQHSENTGWY
jgi:hypothetical protein